MEQICFETQLCNETLLFKGNPISGKLIILRSLPLLTSLPISKWSKGENCPAGLCRRPAHNAAKGTEYPDRLMCRTRKDPQT